MTQGKVPVTRGKVLLTSHFSSYLATDTLLHRSDELREIILIRLEGACRRSL